mgnify:CR=1 FL=1
MKNSIIYSLLAIMLCSCGVKTTEVLLTAESGEKCAAQPAERFAKTTLENAVVVDLDDERQTLDGYGVSLTESSAFILACLTDEEREAVLKEFFSEEGANFPIVRTHIGACDFSVEGKYSLCEKDGDTAMETFSLDRDKEGFSRAQYPQIKNEQYDLYHLMKDVAAIKAAQEDKEYRIVANTWTAPAWMKDNKAYYERDWSRDLHRGGHLLPEYRQAYADYLLKFAEAWRAEGVEIWAMTPVNEPQGNDGGWESMDFGPEVEADFIANYMAPTFAKNGFEHIKILGFDQNIFEMSPYTKAIYDDNAAAAAATDGMALHWYGSTFSCFPEVLDSIHALYPGKRLIHTEGCIDNLGCPAWEAVTDPAGFTESGWFNNDSFWWNNCATDWAYSTPYWPELHPAYSACQRYAQYIIEGMNHWMTGFIDWKCVLDSIGGPNHVQNYCGASVMVDYANDIVYYTPYYYVLKQFSRMMRPGAKALGVSETGLEDVFVSAVRSEDGSVVVNVLNKRKEAVCLPLQVGEYSAKLSVPANCVESLRLSL